MKQPTTLIREKQRALELLGWKFERWSKSRQRWVRVTPSGKRARIIEHAWLVERQHDS